MISVFHHRRPFNCWVLPHGGVKLMVPLLRASSRDAGAQGLAAGTITREALDDSRAERLPQGSPHHKGGSS